MNPSTILQEREEASFPILEAGGLDQIVAAREGAMTVKEFDKVMSVTGIAFRVPSDKEGASPRHSLVVVPRGEDRFAPCVTATLEPGLNQLTGVAEL